MREGERATERERERGKKRGGEMCRPLNTARPHPGLRIRGGSSAEGAYALPLLSLSRMHIQHTRRTFKHTTSTHKSHFAS